MTTPFEKTRQIAQILLKDAPRPLTEGVIKDSVAKARVIAPLEEKQVETLAKELQALYNISMGEGAILEDNTGHKPWLASRHKGIGWRLWRRYERYLEEEKCFPPEVVDRLDRLTNEVLERLEDPQRPGPWDRRGLLCGHVQSGKTAHYTGLICKAAEAGYKLIVVLAGVHDSLRSQTQTRLDEGFLGYDSSRIQREGGRTLLGVGHLDWVNPPPDAITNSTEAGDFSSGVARRFNVQPGGSALLFVVKKIGPVLRNLLRWAETRLAQNAQQGERVVVKDIPILVIDDESDYASVDTGKGAVDEAGEPDPDYSPKVINGLIRKILHVFEKSAYVGYTATPFANIFVHHKARTEEHGEDLYPRSFIINLPAPSNYVGPARVFGHDRDDEAGLEGRECLPIIVPVTDYTSWVPDGHKKSLVPGELPESLREAIRCFILACAARRARGQVTRHNSMLIHVTRWVDTQEKVARQVEDELDLLRKRWKRGDGNASSNLVDELRILWEKNFLPTTKTMNQRRSEEDDLYPLTPWKEVLAQFDEVFPWVEVRQINGTAGDVLDYTANEEQGLSVIAIGGDKLSRGLTLEGLTVSYYLRASKMYDTLMQMGRWFGYRPGYLDLCRLYTTDELIEWYEHIAVASEELRKEFDHMVALNATPEQYGLRVRSHPELQITSSVKMRHGVPLELSYAGGISETISFHTKQSILEDNFRTTDLFIRKLGTPSKTKKTQKGSEAQPTCIWMEVPGDVVVDYFLVQMHVPPEMNKVKVQLLAKYINDRMADGELMKWTIALISSATAKGLAEIGGHKVGLIVRAALSKDPYRIRRLVSPVDELIDLTEEQLVRAKEETLASWQPDEGRSKRKTPPTDPSGPMVRAQRAATNGLLLIYPLDPEAPGVDMSPIGFAFSFPGSERAKKVEYVATNIYWQQEAGTTDGE